MNKGRAVVLVDASWVDYLSRRTAGLHVTLEAERLS